MRVAIVGAGFYGCYFAGKLAAEGIAVTLYEKNSTILDEAISNNQQRLHLGFHYPRSPQTIQQAKDSFPPFLEEFPNSTHAIPNLYAIHRNSFIDFESFCRLYSELGVSYEVRSLRDVAELFTDIDLLGGALMVNERLINLSMLKSDISGRLGSVDVKLNALVDTDGLRELSESHDFVINCSYSNMSIEPPSALEFELVYLPLVTAPRFKSMAVTIMDGKFCSIYPSDIDGVMTLSHVEHSVVRRSNSSTTLYRMAAELTADDERSIAENILINSGQLLNLTGAEIVGAYRAIKAKKVGVIGDDRRASITMVGNVCHVYQGKISAAIPIYNEIMEQLCLSD